MQIKIINESALLTCGTGRFYFDFSTFLINIFWKLPIYLLSIDAHGFHSFLLFPYVEYINVTTFIKNQIIFFFIPDEWLSFRVFQPRLLSYATIYTTTKAMINTCHFRVVWCRETAANNGNFLFPRRTSRHRPKPPPRDDNGAFLSRLSLPTHGPHTHTRAIKYLFSSVFYFIFLFYFLRIYGDLPTARRNRDVTQYRTSSSEAAAFFVTFV